MITEIKGSDLPMEAKIMMFRCCECGNLFEEGEQAVWEETHGLDSPPYETWSGCPVCKGDYEEVHQCRDCGDWHSEDELYDGWCEKCLRETINYDTFFEYCEANKKHNYLDTFVMCYLLNCDEVPDHPSWDFHQLMIKRYKVEVKCAKHNENFFGLLQACIRFIMDDDGDSGRENYAEWLNKREVK